MTVRFNPPQLQSARVSPVLVRVVDELATPGRDGELRVLRSASQEPMRLVFIGEGREPASVSLPGDWLYSEVGEAQVREQVARLVCA
jgi:hypothetical protein